MIYLKIFHKHFMLLVLFLIAGCATDINSGVSAEVVNVKNFDSVNTIPLEEEPVIVFSVSVSEEPENIESVPDIGWTDPESEKLEPLLFLPKVPVEEKIPNEYEISEILYTYLFFDNDNFGWNEIYFFETEIIEEIIVETNSPPSIDPNSEIEQKPVIISSNKVVQNEEITKTIYYERNLNGYIRVKLDILLNGRGWIYLPDKDNYDLEYIGRKFVNENTVYTFLPIIERDYKLRFQYQDLTDNIITIEIITLSIFKDQPIQIISNLNDRSENEDSLIEENIDFKSSVNSMLEKGDSVSLSNIIPELLESNESDILRMLPGIIELLYEDSFYISVSTILEKLILDESFNKYSDYYLYLLGKIYEQDSQIRNELISADYYKTLIDTYPSSIYWDEAQDRYRYLKRRYIDIR